MGYRIGLCRVGNPIFVFCKKKMSKIMWGHVARIRIRDFDTSMVRGNGKEAKPRNRNSISRHVRQKEIWSFMGF